MIIGKVSIQFSLSLCPIDLILCYFFSLEFLLWTRFVLPGWIYLKDRVRNTQEGAANRSTYLASTDVLWGLLLLLLLSFVFVESECLQSKAGSTESISGFLRSLFPCAELHPHQGFLQAAEFIAGGWGSTADRAFVMPSGVCTELKWPRQQKVLFLILFPNLPIDSVIW